MIFVLVYFVFLKTPDLPESASSALSDLEVKLDLFEDDRFKELEASPGVPLKAQTSGKKNPFSD